MSESERRSFEIAQTREVVFARDRGACVVCGKPATQLAHRVPQTKSNLAKYGKARIHSPDNLRAVCGLACNAAVAASRWEWESIMEDIGYA